MPELKVSNAACQYLVSRFEVSLAPAPKEADRPKDYDLKHYTASEARIINGFLFPIDCAIVEFRMKDEALTTKWTKQAHELIKSGMPQSDIDAIHGRSSSLLMEERENLYSTEGKALATFTLDATLLKRLKEEWPTVDRPINYKQRSLSYQVTAALDKATDKTSD